jgi:hypothetical protein
MEWLYWIICNVDLIPMPSKGNLDYRGWHQNFEWNDDQEKNGEVEVWCSNSSASTFRSKSIPQLAKLKYQFRYHSRSYDHCKTFERYQVALSCSYNEKKKKNKRS